MKGSSAAQDLARGGGFEVHAAGGAQEDWRGDGDGTALKVPRDRRREPLTVKTEGIEMVSVYSARILAGVASMSPESPTMFDVNAASRQTDRGMGWLALTLAAGLGLVAVLRALVQHIRRMWWMAQTFLEPMWAAVKTLILVSLTSIAILFVMVRGSNDGHGATPSSSIVANENVRTDGPASW
jgi:hypothetical protein